MVLKLIGSICLLFAGTVFGFYRAAEYAKRPQQIRQLIGMLQRLETEVSYGLTPLPEALRAVSRQGAEPLAGLLRSAAEQLAAKDGRSMREIWQESVKQSWGSTSLKSNEQEIMLDLGLTLGISESLDQVKHLRLAVSQLQVVEAAALDEQRRYERMWRSLGVLVGALAVILMY